MTAVKFIGVGDEGEPLFDAELSCPDANPAHRNATEAQALSVARFYGVLPKSLTYDQAHALLSYRNYARSLADIAFIRFHDDVVSMFAQLLACHISHDSPMAADAIAWSESCFDNPDQSPPVESTPSAAKAFQMFELWTNEIADAGITFDTYC